MDVSHTVLSSPLPHRLVKAVRLPSIHGVHMIPPAPSPLPLSTQQLVQISMVMMSWSIWTLPPKPKYQSLLRNQATRCLQPLPPFSQLAECPFRTGKWSRVRCTKIMFVSTQEKEQITTKRKRERKKDFNEGVKATSVMSPDLVDERKVSTIDKTKTKSTVGRNRTCDLPTLTNVLRTNETTNRMKDLVYEGMPEKLAAANDSRYQPSNRHFVVTTIYISDVEVGP
ncbi:hypothetical protein KCU99_g134, partial [Aureobasidium melanogenum]